MTSEASVLVVKCGPDEYHSAEEILGRYDFEATEDNSDALNKFLSPYACSWLTKTSKELGLILSEPQLMWKDCAELDEIMCGFNC